MTVLDSVLRQLVKCFTSVRGVGTETEVEP